MRNALSFEYVLTGNGLESERCIRFDEAGRISAVEPAAGPGHDGFLALPGMPNAHSHAFQRALAGAGERALGADSFWSWREAMYGLAQRITPEDLYAIARRAYADMLCAGFTSVAEFHYLHHLPDGSAGPEMAEAVIAAAADTGIRLVLLPVCYLRGGFARDVAPAQRRFAHRSLDDYLELLAALGGVPRGIAPHSLRAVPAAQLAGLVQGAERILGPRFPIHIHIAEQRREVAECLAHHGRRPIELLADSVELDRRWSLVHATHASEAELELAARRAQVVLCPLTEAYLGDGIFAAYAYLGYGGRLAIGSDSNVRIDPLEELRMLEYGQRLSSERRCRLATSDGLGMPLWQRAAAGGAAALGIEVGLLEPGRYADLTVLDAEAPALAGLPARQVLDALIVACSAREVVADVYVGGRRLVAGGRLEGEDPGPAYARTLHRLGAGRASAAQ